MTPIEAILAGIDSALTAAGVSNVLRDRQETIETLPAVVIEPESCEETEIALTQRDGELLVAISIYASGETPSTTIDAVLEDVRDVMLPGADFGVSGAQLMPGVSYEWDFENYDYARVSIRYRVIYRG